MQQFYQRLSQTAEVFDPYFQGLAQLKQVDRRAISVLASDLHWFNWGAPDDH
jgi:hypothetical protein